MGNDSSVSPASAPSRSPSEDGKRSRGIPSGCRRSVSKIGMLRAALQFHPLSSNARQLAVTGFLTHAGSCLEDLSLAIQFGELIGLVAVAGALHGGLAFRR